MRRVSLIFLPPFSLCLPQVITIGNGRIIRVRRKAAIIPLSSPPPFFLPLPRSRLLKPSESSPILRCRSRPTKRNFSSPFPLSSHLPNTSRIIETCRSTQGPLSRRFNALLFLSPLFRAENRDHGIQPDVLQKVSQAQTRLRPTLFFLSPFSSSGIRAETASKKNAQPPRIETAP